MLWKVKIPESDDDALQNLVLIDDKANSDEASSPKKLQPTWMVEDALGDLTPMHIHVIMMLPTINRVVRCKVTYIQKSKSFQWTVTKERTTLADLKMMLHTQFLFPDGTEDRFIEINHAVDENILHIPTDKELVRVIWNDNRTHSVDLSIAVSTSQQPFSSWTFDKMTLLFGLKATSYDDLPRFKQGTADITMHSQFVEIVLDEIMVCLCSLCNLRI